MNNSLKELIMDLRCLLVLCFLVAVAVVTFYGIIQFIKILLDLN